MSLVTLFQSLTSRTFKKPEISDPWAFDPWGPKPWTTGAEILAAVPPAQFAESWSSYAHLYFTSPAGWNSDHWTFNMVKEVALTMPLTTPNITAFITFFTRPRQVSGSTHAYPRPLIALFLIRRSDFTASHGQLVYDLIWKQFMRGSSMQSIQVADMLAELSFRQMLPLDSPTIPYVEKIRNTSLHQRRFYYSLPHVSLLNLMLNLSPVSENVDRAVTPTRSFEPFEAMLRRFPGPKTFVFWPEVLEFCHEEALYVLDNVPAEILAEHFPKKYIQEALQNPNAHIRYLGIKLMALIGQAKEIAAQSKSLPR